MNMSEINQALLQELFEYKDGDLYWKKVPSNNYRLNQMKVGYASTKSKYLQVSIHKKKYYVHRIVFMFHHGFMPEALDHIDGNKKNNAIENLRQATLSQNQYNKKIARHNTSGIKGVYWHKRSEKWMARCTINKKCFYIGSYKNLNEAKVAVINFRKTHHGEFARNA